MPALATKQTALRLITVLILCSPVAVLAQGGDAGATREKLELVEKQITQLASRLSSFKEERDALQRQLRAAEKEAGRIQRKIISTRKELDFKQGQLDALTDQRSTLMRARAAQQELIAKEIQTAYQVGRQGKLKILLNQGDPNTLSRAMAYYEYFYEARNARMDEFMDIVRRIDDIEPEITAATTRLATTEAELQSQLTELAASRERRQQTLASLAASIRSDDQKLKKLGRDREELEDLLSAIEEAVADLYIPVDIRPFAELKGKMPWPVSGKPSNRFGRLRDGGPLRWQGVMIPASEGSNVAAIHHGRVVFSDWFRGAGLLLIIDHGDGYMSLYGHNQTLLREVGEWVAAGDPIATVGNSGGQQRAALYFEIRKSGKPADPSQWCKRA